jgi:colicin import membrane protein
MAFTFMVHAGLIAALFFGVQWKRSKPEVMEVELWSSRPVPAVQVAEPPPPPEPVVKPEPKLEPKPIPKVEPEPPKKPDIAIKEEKKPKPEPKKPEPKPEPPKPEPKKPEPKPEVKPPPKMPDFSKELSRETAELKPRPNNSAQQMANAAAAESEQRASSNKKGLKDYAAKIRGKIRGNIVLTPNITGNPEAIFEVDQLPSGEVLAVKLKRSSGNKGLDEAIERAILKSSPLPKPDDPALFQRTLEIKYKPFEE